MARACFEEGIKNFFMISPRQAHFFEFDILRINDVLPIIGWIDNCHARAVTADMTQDKGQGTATDGAEADHDNGASPVGVNFVVNHEKHPPIEVS